MWLEHVYKPRTQTTEAKEIDHSFIGRKMSFILYNSINNIFFLNPKSVTILPTFSLNLTKDSFL